MFGSSVKIKIERDLYERLKTKAESVGYATVEEMIAHVLQREVAEDQRTATDDEIEKRLRGLGYIDSSDKSSAS